jgi:Right handed beta helix region
MSTRNTADRDETDSAGSGHTTEGSRLLGRKSVLVGMLASGFAIAGATQPPAAAAGVVGALADNQPPYAPRWAALTDYETGQQVISPGNDVVSAGVTHTSSTSFSADTANWTLSSSFASKATETTVTSGRLSQQSLTAAYPEVGNVVGPGIDPTGATECSEAIQSILSDAASGKIVNLPPGTYLASGLTLPSGVILNGHGATIKAPPSAAGPILTVRGAYGTKISGITFTGNLPANTAKRLGAASGTQSGVYITTSEMVILSECQFKDFGQSGVHFSNVGNVTTGARFDGASNKVIGCQAENCYLGFWLDQRAEYITTSNSSAVLNRFGGWVQGGSSTFTGCNFNNNFTGLLVAADVNGGHGSATACTFNHNGPGPSIQINEKVNGFSFTGCQVFAGSMTFYRCTGAVMTGCEFGSLSIRAAGGGRNWIYNSVAVGAVTVTHRYLGEPDLLTLSNVFRTNGTALT